MHPMSALLPHPSHAARGGRRDAQHSLLCGLALIAALLAAPSAARAQGHGSDGRVAAGETAASHPGARQVHDAGDDDEWDDEYADTDPAALTDFHQPLTPYGAWVEDPTYGTVWVPSVAVVGADFAPYQTAGRWAMTDEGDWLWVSDYSWGHIPFHYGRWVWISGRGWAWIPGRVYAPAWVVWRTGDHGYIGWAPMPPTYYWVGGAAVSLWVVPRAAFIFCPSTYVFHHHVHTYVVRDRHTVHRIAAHSHTYRPARPSGSSPGGAHARRGASPSAGDRHSLYRPASPSLAEAGVPAASAPKSRARPDARALAYSRKSTAPGARSLAPSASSSRAVPSPRAQRNRGLKDPWARRSGSAADRSSRASRSQPPVLRTPGARPPNSGLTDPWSGQRSAPRSRSVSPRSAQPGLPKASPAPPVHRPNVVTPRAPAIKAPPAPAPAAKPQPAAPSTKAPRIKISK